MGENLEDRFDLVTDLLSKQDNRLGNIMEAPQTRLSAALDPQTAYSALNIHDNKSNVLKAMCAAIKFDKERNQNILRYWPMNLGRKNLISVSGTKLQMRQK